MGTAIKHPYLIIIIIIIIIIKRKLKAQINRKNVANAPRSYSYQKL